MYCYILISQMRWLCGKTKFKMKIFIVRIVSTQPKKKRYWFLATDIFFISISFLVWKKNFLICDEKLALTFTSVFTVCTLEPMVGIRQYPENDIIIFCYWAETENDIIINQHKKRENSPHKTPTRQLLVSFWLFRLPYHQCDNRGTNRKQRTLNSQGHDPKFIG